MELFRKAGINPYPKAESKGLNDQKNAPSRGKQSVNVSRYHEYKSKVDKLSNELSLMLNDNLLTKEDMLVITGSVCEKDNKISITPSIHIINEGNKRLEIKDCDGNVSKNYTLISDFKGTSPITNVRTRSLNGGKKSSSRKQKNVALKHRKTRKLSKK